MGSINKGLIQYNGIDDFCKPKKLEYFNHIIRDFTFCMPINKPDIEQILKVWLTPSICMQKLVKTPQGTSLEGQMLTGYKVMITGEINYRIEYMAAGERIGLHTAHTTQPFSSYITLPKEFNPYGVIIPSIFVEDITAEQLDSRSVYTHFVMMLVADLC